MAALYIFCRFASTVVVVGAVGSLASVGACSDDASPPSSAAASPDTGTDGPPGLLDAAAEASRLDSSDDSGVHEKAAPDCNDMPQRSTVITPAAEPSPPPPATPLTSLAPGLYVSTSIVEFQTTVTKEPASQSTAVVTPTRYYYRYDDAVPNHAILTTDWKVEEGMLVRMVLCSSNGAKGTASHRIDAAEGGFIIYTLSQENRPVGVRYRRIE